MSRNSTVSIQIGPKNGFLSAAMYIVLGILTYLWLGTYAIFTWVDPWLYVYMVFWPFIIMWNVFVWVVIIGVIILVGILLWEWFDKRG